MIARRSRTRRSGIVAVVLNIYSDLTITEIIEILAFSSHSISVCHYEQKFSLH